MTTHTAAPLCRPAQPDPESCGATSPHIEFAAVTRADFARVVAAADHMMAQCESLIHDVPVGNYASESALMPGGSVGKHLRHCLDHFAALRPASNDAIIDYDHRARNVPAERDPAAAVAIVRGLREWLGTLGPDAPGGGVRVRIMVSSAGDTAELDSTLARELAFATHHAVHHLAMVRVIAGEFGVTLDADFGKAPSTLHDLRGAHSPAR